MSSQQSPSRVGESEDDGSLHSAARRTLQQAARARHDAVGGNAALRRSIRALADDARSRGLRAEQLVVALREAWQTLPEARAITSRASRVELAAVVIGICIDEYYAGLREDGDAGAESRSADSGEQ
jgi:hypothetical protein